LGRWRRARHWAWAAAGLGEHRIRDLNDEINRLFRDKRLWEVRIIELGGRNWLTEALATASEADGVELPGSGGYKYFGAAKDLPGVRELFDAGKSQKKKRSRAEIHRRLRVDYFGFRDEEDPVLLKEEAVAEGKMRALEVASWHDAGGEDAPAPKRVASGTESSVAPVLSVATSRLPSEDQIQQRLMEKKKAMILSKYGLSK
jgi:pre-mRNA-splicing factor ISY1